MGLNEQIVIQEEKVKKAAKREKAALRGLEKSSAYIPLKDLQVNLVVQKRALTVLLKKRSQKDLVNLSDVEINIIHTNRGIEDKIKAGIIIADGNLVRLVRTFMFFADYSDPLLPLLDLGSRDGWFMEFLIQAGYSDVHGVEICPAAMNFMRARKLQIRELDVQKLEDVCLFGTITALHVIEHCSNPQLAVNNICRALKPVGILVAEVPLEACPFPMNSAHFSSFPEKEDFFSLFDSSNWELLNHQVVAKNRTGSKRTLTAIYKRR